MKRIILFIIICLFQGIQDGVSQTVDLGLARKYIVLANSGVFEGSQNGMRQMSDNEISERDAAGLTASSRTGDVGVVNAFNNLVWQSHADLSRAAINDMLDAYDNALLLPPSYVDFNNGEIGGAILSPGVYKWNSDVYINENIVFSGGEDDVWVFQIHGDFMQADGTNMDLPECGQENNVFWIVSGSSTIGQNANFEGNLIAKKDITLQREAEINGRVFSQEAVYLNDNIFRYADGGILTITKIADQHTYYYVGQVVMYTIVVYNDGVEPIFNVDVDDPFVGLHKRIHVLNPCNPYIYHVFYTITQEDIDNGSIVNTVCAESIDELHNECATETIYAIKDARVTLTKSADKASFNMPGETITYQIVVNNPGNVTLKDVLIQDDITNEEWFVSILSPGESETFSTSYVTKQSDIDAGYVRNTARVGAVDPQGELIEDEDHAIVFVDQFAELSINKTTGDLTYDAAGDELSYEIVVSNTGNVTLTDVTVTDDLTGESWTLASLAPGVSMTFNTTYAVSQADVDVGEIRNIAAATGTDPRGTPVNATDEAVVQAIQLPALVVVKSANPLVYENVGDQINYVIEVSNSGNVTISNITVTDNLTGQTWIVAMLRPGESVVYNTSYLISQADIDNMSVVNEVVAAGVDPKGGAVEAADQAIVTVIMKPAILVTKAAYLTTVDTLGESIAYEIEITNTGNVLLVDIVVFDDLTNETWEIALLMPGEKITFNTLYEITQTDLNAGIVENTVNAVGKDPAGGDVSGSDQAIVTVLQNPGISLVKTASPNTFVNAGDQITYTIVVTNTGNVVTKEIHIFDDLTQENWIIDELSPGNSHSINTTYTIVQADMDGGTVVNLATANGVGPAGQPVTDSDEAIVTAIQNPSLSITKTATPKQYTRVGNVITYSIFVKNTGNVTITGIVVEDDILDAVWNIEKLSPDESMSFNVTYTITQDEMDAGLFYNKANIAGYDPSGNVISASDEEIVTIDRMIALLEITKTADPPVFITVGELITYTIVIKNTGNVTISNITIVDDLTAQGWSLGSLAPGESQQFSTTYNITGADMNRGELINIVDAYGYDPQGNMVSVSAEETIITIRIPGGLTPDTDFDDKWFIRGLDYFPQNTVQIFNRWGTLVYEASPYVNDWDGVPNRGLIATDADGRVPAGTYYYVLVLKPGFKPMSGYIYLIKN